MTDHALLITDITTLVFLTYVISYKKGAKRVPQAHLNVLRLSCKERAERSGGLGVFSPVLNIVKDVNSVTVAWVSKKIF